MSLYAPASGSFLVPRGGSWCNDPQGARIAGRVYITLDYRNYGLSVRLARRHP